MYPRPHLICVAALVCQSAPALAIFPPGSACGMPNAPEPALYALTSQPLSRCHSGSRQDIWPLDQPNWLSIAAAICWGVPEFSAAVSCCFCCAALAAAALAAALAAATLAAAACCAFAAAAFCAAACCSMAACTPAAVAIFSARSATSRMLCWVAAAACAWVRPVSLASAATALPPGQATAVAVAAEPIVNAPAVTMTASLVLRLGWTYRCRDKGALRLRGVTRCAPPLIDCSGRIGRVDWRGAGRRGDLGSPSHGRGCCRLSTMPDHKQCPRPNSM